MEQSIQSASLEQSIQTAAFIYGFISLVTLIVFFVMANNVSIMTDQILQIKNTLNRPDSNIGKTPEESTGWLYDRTELDNFNIEPAVEDPERAAALEAHLLQKAKSAFERRF